MFSMCILKGYEVFLINAINAKEISQVLLLVYLFAQTKACTVTLHRPTSSLIVSYKRLVRDMRHIHSRKQAG